MACLARGATTIADPDDADFILVAESSHYEADLLFSKLRKHQLSQDFRSKVFIYNEQDLPHDALPGYIPQWQRDG